MLIWDKDAYILRKEGKYDKRLLAILKSTKNKNNKNKFKFKEGSRMHQLKVLKQLGIVHDNWSQ